MAEQIGKYISTRGKKKCKRAASRERRQLTKKAIREGKEPPVRVIKGWDD